MNQEIPFLRWYVKKAARAAMVSAWRIRSIATPSRTPLLHVLTYHRFGPSYRDPFCVHEDEFEEHMQWIAKHAHVASLQNFLRIARGVDPLVRNTVLVTIDDGDKTVAEYALPIMARYKIPAVTFVIASEVETPSRMSWDELRTLQAQGIEIGSHAFTHRSMARISRSEMENEAKRSKEVIEHHLGQPVTSFAYPFGTRADYSDETAATLAKAKYECAFTSQHGSVHRGCDRMMLPRVKVEGGDPSWLFPLLCEGGMDAWSWVDRAAWRVQKPFENK